MNRTTGRRSYDSDCFMEQVLLLAKNAKGLSSVIDLVSNALTFPDLFVFGELLELPAVQQLREEPQFRPWHAALELYAYGTWKEYTDSPGTFPELSPKQLLKLKQLTLISMAQSRQVLPYGELKEALEFSGTRDLEDFLINSCFYCRILKGKLDQAQERLMVQDSINRDVRVQDFPQIKDKLRSWFQSSERSLEDILQHIVYTSEAVEKNEKWKRELAAEAERRMEEIKDLDGMRMDTSDVMSSFLTTDPDERDVKSRRGEGSGTTGMG